MRRLQTTGMIAVMLFTIGGLALAADCETQAQAAFDDCMKKTCGNDLHGYQLRNCRKNCQALKASRLGTCRTAAAPKTSPPDGASTAQHAPGRRRHAPH